MRFLAFSQYATGLSVYFVYRPRNMLRYFGSLRLHVSAVFLVFVDSLADFSSCFTNILLLIVVAFEVINSRATQFVNLLVLRRQTSEKCSPLVSP
ncbi:unnamed protein product [Protopolystoma xenopodis]|uniref:Uncharacterized protein n=1 Tax=Protopolystoma xenopodis TaxID=117903 RepID=A0A448WQ47_9PLAT|nr:unnamed protein product [Protopolystoma xenopodis]